MRDSILSDAERFRQGTSVSLRACISISTAVSGLMSSVLRASKPVKQAIKIAHKNSRSSRRLLAAGCPLRFREFDDQFRNLFQRHQAGIDRKIVVFGARPIVPGHLVEIYLASSV